MRCYNFVKAVRGVRAIIFIMRFIGGKQAPEEKQEVL